MPILKSALEEPLLSRSQTAVLRDIARAAQLAQGLSEVKKIIDSFDQRSGYHNLSSTYYKDLTTYLQFEINRVLTQIKVPAIASGNQGDQDASK